MSTVRPYRGPGAYPVRVYVTPDPVTGKRRRRSLTIHARNETEYRREVRRAERKLEHERDDELVVRSCLPIILPHHHF